MCRMFVTPASLLVVAPAGYNLAATIWSPPPLLRVALARRISSLAMRSVRYSVIKGVKSRPSGTAARIRAAYASACSTDVTGGWRLGMMIARANWAAVCGTTVFRA